MTGAIAWFTGLPSSGKTTLARRVQQQLAGRTAVLLDSDELRHVLGAGSYAPDDRDRFYRALAAMAVLIAQQGPVVLVAATAPHRRDRDRARAMAGGAFIEVWVNTPLEACEARDPKGLYAQARDDAGNQLPGVGVAYEPPIAPEVVADGGQDDAALAVVIRLIERIDQAATATAATA